MKLTVAQMLLIEHLVELGFKDEEICAEHMFYVPGRKWRFDVAIPNKRLAIECNGHWQGHHGKGWSEGAEKLNVAQMLGWRVLQFHNREVLNGNAKAFIKEWMEASDAQR